ncbi:MAG: hypothetical protein ACM3MG_04215 [Bacillota bacterium]
MRTFVAIAIFNFSLSASAEHLSSISCSNSNNIQPKNTLSVRWDSAEHSYLGDLALKNICADMNVPANFCPVKFPRYDKKTSYTYGQMAALGDFYKSGDHMFEETGSQNISPGGMGNIFQCMDKEGKVMHEQRKYPEFNFPNCNWVFLLNSRQYVILAENNFDHFSWGAVKAYIREHSQALQLARYSFDLRKQDKLNASDYYFRRAVFVNAVADHYLMDLFAAGHVDVPRLQVRQFAEGNLSGILKKLRGDAMSIVLHANNSRDQQLHEIGLAVVNPRGDTWWTHSDGHMMTCVADDMDQVIHMPTLAVQQSLKDLYEALIDGKSIGEYKALEYVPRSKSQILANKYKYVLTSDLNQKKKYIDQLKEAIPGPLKVITSNKDIELMIRNLPIIIQRYQEQIQSDLSHNENLRKRMSSAVQSLWYLGDENDSGQ